MKTLRIGAGSASWGDRIEPAQWNAERGALDYLCFETMAEATISAAQVRGRRDPGFPGYDTYLDDWLAAVLPAALARHNCARRQIFGSEATYSRVAIQKSLPNAPR